MAVPEKLGKYRITDRIGEGAMGVVYKAFDPDIRRVVALKTIRRQLDDGSEFADSIAARFRNEAQAAGRLQHPGIVAVYDYGEDQHTAFIAMEFVEGSTLSHYLANKVRFSDDDVQSVICQLLDGLDHAHQQGVWHRDIKPANLIMTRTGRLKIADFGIARIDTAGLTQTHMMIGTPSYMAPEQYLGAAIDARVDIYAAGVLLYQLLTGRPPFVGSAESLSYQIVHEKPAPPSQVDAGTARPRCYDAIVARALAKEPGQRFPTAAAFRAELMAAIGAAASATVSEATVVSVVPRRLAPVHEPTLPLPGSAARSAGASVGGSAGGSAVASSGRMPTHWDAQVLSRVESTLAQHVGPLAGVLVRRAARDCDDLASLYSRLADQVTSPMARAACLAQAAQAAQAAQSAPGTRAWTGTEARVGADTGSGGASGAGSTSGRAMIDEAVCEGAARLLAQHVGPIARILVKKAAAVTTQREAFAARLAEAIAAAEPRRRFLADFERLP